VAPGPRGEDGEHGRVRPEGDLEPWLVAEDGEVLGWHGGRVAGTTLHGLFERDGFRAAVLAWAAERSGKRWSPTGVDFAAARMDRLDRIADALEAHLDLAALEALIAEGAP
jgi:adenosylcobyric acid synthase